MKEKNASNSSDYMALRQKAYELIVIKGKSQKEASRMLNVSENSISKWSKRGNWKEIRVANETMSNNPEYMFDRLKSLFADICEIDNKELRLRIARKLIGEGL